MKYFFVLIALVAGNPVPESTGLKGIIDDTFGNNRNNNVGFLSASSNKSPSINNEDEAISVQAKKGVSNRNSLPNQDQGFFSGVQSTSGSFKPRKKSRNPHSYHGDYRREGKFGYQGDSMRSNDYNNFSNRDIDYYNDDYDSDRSSNYDNRYNVRSVYRRDYGYNHEINYLTL